MAEVVKADAGQSGSFQHPLEHISLVQCPCLIPKMVTQRLTWAKRSDCRRMIPIAGGSGCARLQRASASSGTAAPQGSAATTTEFLMRLPFEPKHGQEKDDFHAENDIAGQLPCGIPYVQTEKHPARFCRLAGCLRSVILFCSVSCYRELLLRLLYTPAPITPAADTVNRANHSAKWLLSPVCGGSLSSGSFTITVSALAISFVAAASL